MNLTKRIKLKKLCTYLSFIIITTTVFPGNIASAEEGTDTGASTEYITQAPEPTITPAADGSVTDPTAAPVPSGTVTPTLPPTDLTPIPSISATPTPSPTKAPFRSKTLQLMSNYDYIGSSVTGVTSQKETLKTLQSYVKSFGTLYGTGMPYAEYKKAMGYVWKDATEYDKKLVKINVDLTKSMDYDSYVDILKKLSRYPGVYLYKIGTSMEGRDLYAVEIDVDSNSKKNVIVLTGQIHAREFGGGTFIVKQFVDLVQKAQTDKSTMELLKKNKFVAVPIINVDGREAIIDAASKWNTRNGLWKAYTNGTDGGRNFPGLQWGQVAKGTRYKSTIALKPGYANYPGPYAGSNSETKALMKFLYHYTVVEQAAIYLDLHNQGAIVYAGKTWQTDSQAQLSRDLRTNVMNVLNKGITRRKYTRVYEGPLYGMQGEGSSLTDYATSLAVGGKFSPAYGFMAFTNSRKEYILMQIKDLDTSSIRFKEANKKFAALTIEIGYGDQYLGNSANTRRLLANEYNYYNYGKLLEVMPNMIQ